MNRLYTPLLLLVLFLAAWFPRAMGLERFVTIDERKWLARSANFYQAVSHADWLHTFQREHPGVTVMWAGMLAFLQQYPTYAQEAPGQFTWERENFEAWLEQNTSYSPLMLLAAGRRWVVLIISLTIALSYLPLRRLLGLPIAALAALFVAWDPFAVAMSQQLHPDGFVAALTLLALLLFVVWLYGGGGKGYLVGSGIVMGLAWLTKTPAILLVPVGAVLIGLRLRRWPWAASAPDWQLFGRLCRGFVWWGVVATATFVLLWPAMWVNPVGTLLGMASEMEEYVERHTTINYFWGRPVDDPGPLFYPIAYLFRSSPAALIGLLLAAVAGWRRFWPLDTARFQRTAAALCIFVFILAAGMTLGAKKFDRYLLPAFPALDILAALGWLAALRWLYQRWRPSVVAGDARRSGQEALPQPAARYVVLPAVVVVLFLHGLPGFLHYPYYLTYYNPLAGGSLTAPKVMFAGWGEGLDEAARWLNAQPEAENLRVVAWYADGPFSYFFKGQAVEVGYSSPLFWLDTDYTVLYINQWQRQQPSPEAINYFLEQTPVYTVRNGGLDLAYIYDMRSTLLPPFVQIGKESSADFGGQIRMSAYDVPQTMVQPGDHFLVTFYLQALAPMEVNYNILVRLIGEDGSELWRDEGWPWGAATRDWPVRAIRPDGHKVTIPENAPPGPYKLVVSFYDPATFEPLPVTAVDSNHLLDPGSRDVALIWVGSPPNPGQTFDPAWRFGDSFALSGATTPDSAVPGDDLRLALQWDSLQRTGTDYITFVHLVDASGEMVAQQDQQPLRNFAPTRLWTPGLRLVDTITIPMPSDISPGQYEVRVGLYTPEGGRLPVARNGNPGGDFVVLGSVTVE